MFAKLTPLNHQLIQFLFIAKIYILGKLLSALLIVTIVSDPTSRTGISEGLAQHFHIYIGS